MTTVEIAQWSGFATAMASACAALTGLLFVAVSINLDRILEHSTLPRLAAATLVLFAVALVGALLVLIPQQSPHSLGGELIAVATVSTAVLMGIHTRKPHYEYTTRLMWLLSRVIPAGLVCVLTFVAAIGLEVDASNALNWLAAADVVAICAALVNAWVLLVEINR